MQINREPTERHSIQAYMESEIQVNNIRYQHSLILSKNKIIPNWPVKSIQELNEETLQPILQINPEVIIIGHTQPATQLPISILQHLSNLRIGIECMLIGPACRTFNVLLNEHRNVAAGIIFRL